MRKIKALIAGIFISFSLMSGVAQATPLVGSISSDGGGLEATGPWETSFLPSVLGWKVYQTAAGWTYDYLYSVPKKEISHIIFEVSETFTDANVLTGTSKGWELGYWDGQGKSNPGIPETIYGLKFETDGLIDFTRIVSDRAPMWGSFYAKDGKHQGEDVYAYNEAFGERSGDSIYGPAPEGFVLVPDTVTSQVPEPGSLALLSLGLLGASLTTAKSRKKFSLRR